MAVSFRRAPQVLWGCAAVVALSLGLIVAGVALAAPAGGMGGWDGIMRELVHAPLDRQARIFMVAGALGLICGLTVAFACTLASVLAGRRA